MDFRLYNLKCNYNTLLSLGHDLLCFHEGFYRQGEWSDDLGIYWLVPKIAMIFDVNVEYALYLFFISISFLSFFTAAISAFYIFHSAISRFIFVLSALFVTYLAYTLYDVYIIPSVTVVLVIPLLICLLRQLSFSYLPLFFIVGIFLGVSNHFRLHAGTGVFIFLVAAIITKKSAGNLLRLSVVIVSISGYFIASNYFDSIIADRNKFLESQVIPSKLVQDKHAFWHSVYIGLGYIPNMYGISYLDEVGIRKVHDINPDAPYLSTEYEEILKLQVFQLFDSDPVFILDTLVAKLSAMIKFLLLPFAAVLISRFGRQPFAEDSSFLIALGFYLVPGLLTMPWYIYLTGFFALSFVYFAFKLGTFLDERMHQSHNA